MNRDALRINTYLDPAPELDPAVAGAIQLAIGVYYRRKDEMPAGLQLAWNDAVEDGAFDRCRTIGDLSRSFLVNRLGHCAIPEAVLTD